MTSDAANTPDSRDSVPGQDSEDRRVTQVQLDDLAECRDFAMRFMRRLDRHAEAADAAAQADGPSDAYDIVAVTTVFTKIERSLRQIIVLERELRGLREPPSRRGPAAPAGPRPSGPEAPPGPSASRPDRVEVDRYNDYDTYDRGPVKSLEDYHRRLPKVLARVQKMFEDPSGVESAMRAELGDPPLEGVDPNLYRNLPPPMPPAEAAPKPEPFDTTRIYAAAARLHNQYGERLAQLKKSRAPP